MASNKRKVKKAVKAAKKYPKIAIAIAVILVIIIAVVLVLYFMKTGPFKPVDIGSNGDPVNNGSTDSPNNGSNDNQNGNGSDDNPDGNGNNNTVLTGSEAEIAGAGLSIHFLELGNKSNGDSIFIKCGDTEVLIDAGSEASSAPVIKSYINKYVTGKLDYVISTHADSDHISAFVGNTKYTGLFYDDEIEIGTLIKFDYSNKALETSSGNKTLYGQYLDAVENLKSNGTAVYTASQCYDQTDGAQRQYYLDDAQTVSINILYNYFYYNQNTSDENNFSVVTLLTEKTADGKRNYLFTGDLEKDGESKMVDYYANVPDAYVTEYNVLPEVDLFKAGHHGSGTSSTEKLLNVIKPKAVAICCCCGAPEYTTNPANTFPYQETCNRLLTYTDKIYITTLATGLPEIGEDGKYVNKVYSGYTPMNGTIVFYSKENELKLWCSNNDTVLKDTDWFKDNRALNS